MRRRGASSTGATAEIEAAATTSRSCRRAASLIASRYPFASSATGRAAGGLRRRCSATTASSTSSSPTTWRSRWTRRGARGRGGPDRSSRRRPIARPVPGGAADPRHVLHRRVEDAGSQVLRDAQRPRSARRRASCCRSTARSRRRQAAVKQAGRWPGPGARPGDGVVREPLLRPDRRRSAGRGRWFRMIDDHGGRRAGCAAADPC